MHEVSFTALDINECASGTDNCDTNAVCANTHGSFTCTCQSGYAGNGVSCDGIRTCRHTGGNFS